MRQFMLYWGAPAMLGCITAFLAYVMLRYLQNAWLPEQQGAQHEPDRQSEHDQARELQHHARAR